MIRAIIQSVIEGAIKRFTSSGRPDETITNREYFQHYGYTSRPLPGSEGIVINEGNHIIMIASDDRRYRIAIEEGEVCIYTDEGDHIRLKRGKEIYIKSGNKLNADIDNEVVIATKRIDATASESALVKSPTVKLKADSITMETYSGITPLATIKGNMRLEGNIEIIGNISVTGNIDASGTIIDGGGNTNHHTH
jgi:phage baseplate assembly protein V